MSNFQTWWDSEGSAMRPLENEDLEEFAKRVTEIAWSNGGFCAIEVRKAFDRATALAEQPAPEMAIADAYRAGVDSGIAAEREACAKVCDDIDSEYEGEDVLATWCSRAIRARGNT